jgi:antitoxin component YwqK of YwqJK toxin-antitoxin module
MLKINYILLLLSVFFLSNCQTEKVTVIIPAIEVSAENTTLSMKEGTLYVNNKPYSGFVIEKYLGGKLASKNGYLNGKLEGKQEKWFENGTQQEVRFYATNRKIGKHEGWYENGQKRFEYFINNDVPIEIHREWYDSGQLFSLLTYNAKGQPEGRQQMWFANGQIKANYVVKNGRRFGLFGAKGCMGENEKKETGLKINMKSEL